MKGFEIVIASCRYLFLNISCYIGVLWYRGG